MVVLKLLDFLSRSGLLCTSLVVHIRGFRERISATCTLLLHETPGKFCGKKGLFFKLLYAVGKTCAFMPGVLSDHHLPKPCMFGYIIVSKVDDRKGWEGLLGSQAEELPHHIIHQSHNSHTVSKDVQLC